MRAEELIESNNHPAAEDVRSQAEKRWLAANGDKYAGQWVALDGSRLLAHGADAPSVYRTSRATLAGSDRVPLVVLVQSADALPFGGW
jgi:hypothetical protein